MPTPNEYALMDACLTGNIDQMDALLHQGINPNCEFLLREYGEEEGNFLFSVPLLYIACYSRLLKYEGEHIAQTMFDEGITAEGPLLAERKLTWRGKNDAEEDTPEKKENRHAIIQRLLDHPLVDPNLIFSPDHRTKEGTLFSHLVFDSNEEEVDLLSKHPKVDINIGDSDNMPLFRAIKHKNHKIVSLLLNNERLDPAKAFSRLANFVPNSMLAFLFERDAKLDKVDDHRKILKEILAYYMRNDVNIPATVYSTNLKFITYFFDTYFHQRKLGVTSTHTLTPEGDIDLHFRYRQFHGDENKLFRIPLDYFLKFELLNEKRAALLFALIVFQCDGLLRVNESSATESGATGKVVRFFNSAKRLPLELQMIVAGSVYGVKGNISSANSESAFRSLGRSFGSK
jgi:hypothetical protein